MGSPSHPEGEIGYWVMAIGYRISIFQYFQNMNKNEKFVITINRELGSGGHTVGRKLAEKLGVQFFDKALIKSLEEKFHLTAEEIEKLKGRKPNWWDDFKRVARIGEGWNMGYAQQYSQGDVRSQPDIMTTAEIFKAETEILQGAAENESCVVTGRSGFFVFRQHPNHLNILIQASMPFRMERVMRKQEVDEDEARKIIEQVDTMRENYVTKYTGTSRYDARNYDLVIKADGKSEDEIVNIILQYIG